MKAMIMAAGIGSRLLPLTLQIPKPMMPVANCPLLENTINHLQQFGYNKLICNVHHHAGIIMRHFNNGQKFGVDLTYSQEQELLGTAGGVKSCEWFLDETFLVISGDTLSDVNLPYLIQEHKSNGALATIALKQVEHIEHFGAVSVDSNDRILCFQEKPRPEEALSHLANTGIYIFEPEIFKYIPNKKFHDFGKQVFPHLVKIGAPFYGVTIFDYWCDVGNLNTYHQANRDALSGLVRVKEHVRRLLTEGGGQVLLGDNVYLGSNVSFSGNVVIGSDCSLQDNARVSNSIIWRGCSLGKGSVVQDAILGSGCQIGRFSRVGPGAVVASGCIIGDGNEILPGTKVFDNPPGALGLEQK